MPESVQRDYDVIRVDEGYAVATRGEIVHTPGGAFVQSSSLRLMEHIARDLSFGGKYRLLTAWDYFVAEHDWLPHEGSGGVNWYAETLKRDVLLQRRMPEFFPKESLCQASICLTDEAPSLVYFYSGLIEAVNQAIQVLMERVDGNLSGLMEDFDRFRDTLGGFFREMPSTRRACCYALAHSHGVGPTLPGIMLGGRVTPAEYANAVISLCWDPEKHPDLNTYYNQLRDDATQALEYLTLCPGRECIRTAGVQELIARGESYGMEFKSTLRFNLKSGKNDPNVTFASLKTMAAFLNSSGGTLLIGVRDDGSIEGIETDRFENEDRFSLALWQSVESHLGGSNTPYVRTSFEQLDGGTVCVVRCQPSPKPVFIRNKGGEDEFYVRVGPSSRRLGLREAMDFISHRFAESERS